MKNIFSNTINNEDNKQKLSSDIKYYYINHQEEIDKNYESYLNFINGDNKSMFDLLSSDMKEGIKNMFIAGYAVKALSNNEPVGKDS